MSGGTRPPPRQPEGEKLTITKFNDLCRQKKFKEGPFIEDFGSGYGEPYCPDHYVWGTLKTGKKVWSIKKPKAVL